MILIITNKEDIHPTPVIAHLNENNIPFFRLNTEALLTDYTFNFNYFQNNCSFEIKNNHTGIIINESIITSIWERRIEKPTAPHIKDKELKRICEAEAWEFLFALRYYLKDEFWIGHAIHDNTASSKLLQLKIANNVGFKIPSTCFANNKESFLNTFADTDSVAIKTLSNSTYVANENEEIVFWTKQISTTTIKQTNDDSFKTTVQFLQGYINKAYELRVTVVGNEVFACKIESQHLPVNGGKIDFRQGYEGLKYSVFELDERNKNRCRAYLSEFKLNFGCFDFVVDNEGKIFFLECNPNGQWLWIEHETGLPISKAIANTLTNVPN